MTPDKAQYRFDERVAIMVENGALEVTAVQAARREVFEALKSEGMSVFEAGKFVTKLYSWK